MAKIKVYCKNIGKYIEVEGGITLYELYKSLGGELAITPICARVNNKTEDLAYPVFSPKKIEFIDRHTPTGDHVYERSLFMLLYKAVSTLYPKARLRMMHSISNGYFYMLNDLDEELTQEVIDNIRTEMHQLVKKDIPYHRHEKLTQDVINIFRNNNQPDKVALLETYHEVYSIYYTLQGTPDCYYAPLAPSTGHIKYFDVQLYGKGLLLLGADRWQDRTRTPIKQKKVFKAFNEYTELNRILNVDGVGILNQAVRGNYTDDMINVGEALHYQKLSKIALNITERFKQGGAKIVLCSGPSSSGKTTTTKRLSIQLLTNLLKPKMISLDDYFVNREDNPRDENGEYDYESLYALDLEQFNKDLKALLNGEEVQLPTYNFVLGKREYTGKTMHLESDDILLMEGIHGLNPQLTPDIPEHLKYKVYISALTTLNLDDHNRIPTSDTRLIRRMVRDSKYRGMSAVDTISRWQSVRAGEEKWIFPFQENADAVFNSSLFYELAVMKEQASTLLHQVPRDTEEYEEAIRLLRFLEYFEPISEKGIPSTSILREFLGGSSFKL